MGIWQKYQDTINRNCLVVSKELNGLPYWQNKLFATILIYLLPLSIPAIVPGIYMSVVSNLPLLAVVDLLTLAFILVIAFAPNIRIAIRKASLISALYLVAVILLYYLGSFGPGLLYLNAVTIFVMLIFSKKAAYWSVGINLIICIAFGIAIHFRWVQMPAVYVYQLSGWIAVCVNLIILCAVTVVLVPMLFNGLQNTITRLEMEEGKTIDANRLYQFISQVNQTIVHTTDEETLFNKVCDIALEYGHYGLAWIGKYNPDDNTINMVQQCGATQQDIKLMKHVTLSNASPTLKVQTSGTHLVYNDIINANGPDEWQEYLLQRGFLSICILPIKRFGTVIGTINLYSTLAGTFNKQEMRLLDEVAGDISFAMEGFEKERHRREIQTRLEQSETVLNKAQEIATIGSWELDLQSYRITWSDEMYRIFGMVPGSIQPTLDDYFSFAHPEDMAWLRADFVRMQSDWKDVSNNHRILLKDGTVKHVFSDAKFDLDSDGNPVRMYGITHDVTKQVLAEKQLVKSEKHLRAIIENSSDGIILRSLSGEATFVSPNSKKILGYDITERMDEIRFDLIHPDYLQLVSDAYKKASSEPGSLHTMEYRVRHKNGTYIWIESAFSNHFGDEDIQAMIINYRDITERKKAQETLLQSEANLRLIIDAVPHSILAKDKYGNFIFANKRFCELYDLNMEDILKKNLKNLIPIKDEAEKFLQEDLDVIKSGGTITIPNQTFTDKNNIVHIFQTTKVPFVPSGWNEMAVLAIAVEITDIIRVEEKLVISEARNRGIFESQTNYVIRTDLEGNYSFCNNKFMNDFGWIYEDGNIIGKPSMLSIIEAHHQRVMDTVGRCFTHVNEVFQVELDKPKKEGGVKTTFWDFICLTNSKGEPSEIQCVGIDISERKKAEEALRESTYILEKAQQVAHVGHWVADPFERGKVTWSDETYQIFGLDKDKVACSVDLFFSVVHPHDIKEVAEVLEKALTGQGKQEVEHRIIRPDGTIRWVHEQAEIIYDKYGNPESILGVCEDITDKKLAEEKLKASKNALRTLNSELEERVLLRTSELIDANQELEAFSYTVSHDLRTPIRAVQIFGNLLKNKFNKNEDETTITYLDNILTCTIEMNDLINDLLEFSKLGRHELKKSNVNMDEMAHVVAASVIGIEEGREITIDIVQLDYVDADATLIRSIWLNLLSNAVKYSKKGTLCEVQVSSSKKGDSILYQVTDNGIGFDMKYYDRLFKPFSRLHTSTDYKGTGAGLAICDRIIKKHGGELWAESIVDKGSTFYFSLPI